MGRDLSDCTGCSACAAICPKMCISMLPDEWGRLYPRVDTERCINCGLCEKNCPLDTVCLENAETYSYSVCNLRDDIRKTSSSGGVFTILAEHVIENGGVVFGAAFDENWDVVHIFADSIPELSRFRGAKYVQSKIGKSYQQAKDFLQNGRLVLFSGTPCQIGGLKAYLGREYENLICQDMICHGVPSPGIWRKYLAELERKMGASAREVSFRCKKRGWKDYLMSIGFKNGKLYQKPIALDPYMRAFISNLSLRSSCFACKYKGISRQADITLADFWGVERIQPEMDDDKGTSLVLVRREKGKRLMEMIHKKARVEPVDTEEALRYNSSAVRSAIRPDSYHRFMDTVNQKKVTQAVEEFDKIPAVLRVKLETYELLQRIRDWKAGKT